jgi:hypothetical protein
MSLANKHYFFSNIVFENVNFWLYLLICHVSSVLKVYRFCFVQYIIMLDTVVAWSKALSLLTRTLGLWVQIPLKAWMFGVYMRLFCVCVFLCLGSSLAMGWPLIQGGLPPVKKWLRNWIRGLGPEWPGRTIEGKVHYNSVTVVFFQG